MKELHPQIPHYYVKRVRIEGELAEALGVSTGLRVTCPQADCPGKHFFVKLRWIKGRYRTRPCPYCFKTAWIPWELPPRRKK